MDSLICRRLLLWSTTLLFCAILTSSQDLDYQTEDATESPYASLLGSESFSGIDGSDSMQEAWFPKTRHLETRRRFLTSKRGWDVIEKIWQPQFPKRAWEFVDRVWKIPKFRKKYLRYLHPNKRSMEYVVNTPVQSQRQTDLSSPRYKSALRDYTVNDNMDERQAADKSVKAWSVLKLLKALIRRCCERNHGADTCRNICL